MDNAGRIEVGLPRVESKMEGRRHRRYLARAVASRRCRLAIPFFTTALCAAIALSIADLSPLAGFEETDTWEYQSMAANFAAGRGVNRFGGMVEQLGYYRFELHHPTPEEQLAVFRDAAGVFNAARTPGYPLVLGLFYRAFGVDPGKAKQAQLALLALVACALPAMGRMAWGASGYWCGVVAIPFFLLTNYQFAEQILTEPLVIFVLGLFALCGLWYERRPTPARAALSGVVAGACLLTKGTLLFVPLLFGGYLIWRHGVGRRRALAAHLGAFAATTVLVVAPWSILASREVGRTVLLSSQAKVLLLDANNEWCSDGGWHPEWRDDPQSFYNRDGLEGRSSVLRVLNFYWENPRSLRFLLAKLRAGFPAIGFLGLTVLASSLLGLGHVLSERDGSSAKAPWELYRAVAVLAYTVGLIGAVESSASQAFDPFFEAVYLVGLVVLPVTWKGISIRMPVTFVVISANSLLVTLIVGCSDMYFYRSRHVKVADFVFVLACAYASWKLGRRVLGRAPHEDPLEV